MNCGEVTKLIDGYLDGELDPIAGQAIEAHLGDCRQCQKAYEARSALARTIEGAAPYYRASAELRSRIQSALREEIGPKPEPGITDAKPSLVIRRSRAPRLVVPGAAWSWLALAAAIALAAVIAFNLAPRGERSDQLLTTQLIASHVRSLMATHLIDIASSDQHTVKPWLDERLDFAPLVANLEQEGFPLLGGRLDYLENRPVAALVYKRRKHFINLFIWPITPGSSQTQETIARQGYHLLHWVDGDLNYWVVSDVNESDLQMFRELLVKQASLH